jgi:hypothetical protein
MPDNDADQLHDDPDDVDLAAALPAPDDEELQALAGLGALTDDELREAARELGIDRDA